MSNKSRSVEQYSCDINGTKTESIYCVGGQGVENTSALEAEVESTPCIG
jgi:hypothetical protein